MTAHPTRTRVAAVPVGFVDDALRPVWVAPLHRLDRANQGRAVGLDIGDRRFVQRLAIADREADPRRQARLVHVTQMVQEFLAIMEMPEQHLGEARRRQQIGEKGQNQEFGPHRLFGLGGHQGLDEGDLAGGGDVAVESADDQ